MPQTVIIGAFVLGSVLGLIALLGGHFKIFGAEVSGGAGPGARAVAGIAGTALIAFGLYGGQNPTANPDGGARAAPTTPITVSYLLDRMVEGHATVYIAGKEAGVLDVSGGRPRAFLIHHLPAPGTYEYSIAARMTIAYQDAEGNPTGTSEVESNGHGTIDVVPGKKFVVYTQNINLTTSGMTFYAEMRDE